MTCPGLHCPGCGDGGGIAIAAPVAVAAEIVIRVFWWLIAGTIAAAVLALAAVVLLSRITARREAAFGVQLAARHEREALTAAAMPQINKETAIENHYHVHFHADSREAAPAVTGEVLP
jgi:hypothetical protein